MTPRPRKQALAYLNGKRLGRRSSRTEVDTCSSGHAYPPGRDDRPIEMWHDPDLATEERPILRHLPKSHVYKGFLQRDSGLVCVKRIGEGAALISEAPEYY